jgi:hypothetical protein
LNVTTTAALSPGASGSPISDTPVQEQSALIFDTDSGDVPPLYK